MSYEQAPTFYPSNLPKDGKKRIFIEKESTFEKKRDYDAQVARFKRMGYVFDAKNSNEEADCLVIDQKIIDKRAKAREQHTRNQLLASGPAGISGEVAELSKTEVRGPQNAEAFFGGDGDQD